MAGSDKRKQSLYIPQAMLEEINREMTVDDWGRVWLLPLRADVSPVVVAAVEAFLISALRPSDNVVRPQIRLWPSRVEELLRRVA